MDFNLEKKTGLWTGLFVLVMSIIYILVTLGKTQWTMYIAVIWGFFLGGLLFFEAGAIDYFRKKEYRSVGFGDLVVWLSIAFSVIILVNTILLIGNLRASSPTWIVDFATNTGLIGGIGGAILGVAHILMPRFK